MNDEFLHFWLFLDERNCFFSSTLFNANKIEFSDKMMDILIGKLEFIARNGTRITRKKFLSCKKRKIYKFAVEVPSEQLLPKNVLYGE